MRESTLLTKIEISKEGWELVQVLKGIAHLLYSSNKKLTYEPSTSRYN